MLIEGSMHRVEIELYCTLLQGFGILPNKNKHKSHITVHHFIYIFAICGSVSFVWKKNRQRWGQDFFLKKK